MSVCRGGQKGVMMADNRKAAQDVRMAQDMKTVQEVRRSQDMKKIQDMKTAKDIINGNKIMGITPKWWHDKVAYQIYPKSFMDTNGDGVGDLKGVTGKLDYLKELGVDIIWLSPIYESPFVDQGYDISDYYKIDPSFGTMEEFDELLAQARKRNMFIVMDLVINHCSDRHQWFQKALADPDGPYADYFYFVPGKEGNPPSNYRSYFGGSAWEKVPGTDKFYLHMFAKEQPDLNWNNPAMKEELYAMINWWMDKGVAGFRIDAIINIKKDISFPSFEPDGEDGLVTVCKMVDEVEGVGELLSELKENTFAKYDAFTVAEVFNMKEGELTEFIGECGHFSTMFDFGPHSLVWGENGWIDSPRTVDFQSWKKVICESQLKCQGAGFLANILENHDEPRGISRYLPEYGQNPKGIKMLATVSVMLRGLPFLYQGQEIGMGNCRMNSIDEYDDISTLDQYRQMKEAGYKEEDICEACFRNSRDNARTPMQWSREKNGGFTEGTPWLKCNPEYTKINVEEQLGKKDSVLEYYKRLIALRKHPDYSRLLTYGDFRPVMEDVENVFAYYREMEESEINIFVAANFGSEDAEITLEDGEYQILLSNTGSHCVDRDKILLGACEVIVFERKD